MLLAARGAPTDRKRAIQLLVDKAAADEETLEEKRSTAAILSSLSRHLEGEDRKEVLHRGVEILSEVARESNDRRDLFILVQLHRASGNRQAARETLSGLLARDPQNIDYLVVGLDEATEPSDVKFAEDCAKVLLILYPSEFRAVQAVARFECRQGRVDRARVLAEGFARTADNTPGDLQTRIGRSAELLDELARMPNVRKTATARRMTNAAVEQYESLYTSRPEAIVSAAGLLAADGRPDEAFQRIERHARSLPTRVRVLAGLAVVRAGGLAAQYDKTVKEWIETAKNEEPDSLAVLLHEAEWHTLRQEFHSAERVYEAVLKQDDRNVVGLNNLAWILSARPESTARAEELVERAVREVGLTGELLDTRARIRISARQYDAAERDLMQALAQERTPLRYFHLALVRLQQTPPRKGDALDAFRRARAEGLDIRSVHPADVTLFRALELELKK